MPTRNTLRKRLIEKHFDQTFAGGPVLLDELRWRVFEEESQEKDRSYEQLTRSYQKSFLRTVHALKPHVEISLLRQPHLQPAGLVTRAAAFRIHEFDILHRFLTGSEACVYGRVIAMERQVSGALRDYIAVGFRFFEAVPARYDPREIDNRTIALVSIPITSVIGIVHRSPMALGLWRPPVTWRIFRTASGHPYEISPSESFQHRKTRLNF